MSLYEDLLKKHADACAGLEAFKTDGIGLARTLSDAAREHLGCTPDKLRIRRPGPDEPAIPGAKAGLMIAPGFTLNEDGVCWVLGLKPSSEVEWVIPCALRPTGSHFTAMVGTVEIAVKAGDDFTIGNWCQAVHRAFDRLAAQTSPYDVSGARDLTVGSVTHKSPRQL